MISPNADINEDMPKSCVSQLVFSLTVTVSHKFFAQSEGKPDLRPHIWWTMSFSTAGMASDPLKPPKYPLYLNF